MQYIIQCIATKKDKTSSFNIVVDPGQLVLGRLAPDYFGFSLLKVIFPDGVIPAELRGRITTATNVRVVYVENVSVVRLRAVLYVD